MNKKIYLFSIIYLYLPVLLFVLTWTSGWIAIPVSIMTILALCLGYRRLINDCKVVKKITQIEGLSVFLIFIVLCIFAGGGDLFLQDYDWSKHHAVLRDLVNYRWPVVYDGDAMLTYYLGQYIVPAFIGKLCNQSMFIAVWALTFWNAAGLWLVFYLVCQYVNADTLLKKTGVFIILVLWGGATNFGSEVYQRLGNHAELFAYKWIDFNRIKIHFASNFDALRGAFQHLIVPWICSAIFIENTRKVETYVMLALPLFFASTFGFVYFSVILFASVIIEAFCEENKNILRRLFSQNNVLLLPVSFVFVIYYIGNVFGKKPDSVGFEFVNMTKHIQFYLVFIAVEFIIYAVCLFLDYKKNVLYYIIIGELLIIPFFSMGLYNDLCSRGSIPARFILMLWCIQQILKRGRKYICNILLVCVFVVAALNTLNEVKLVCYRTIVYGLNHQDNIMDEFGTLNGMAGNPEKQPDEAYNYFTLDYKNSIFYYISR